MDRLPDEALLSGLATGDPELAVVFVRRFQRWVFGVAMAVTGDEQLAGDVAQSTFERAWRYAQIYDSRRGSVTTWGSARRTGAFGHRSAQPGVRSQ